MFTYLFIYLSRQVFKKFVNYKKQIWKNGSAKFEIVIILSLRPRLLKVAITIFWRWTKLTLCFFLSFDDLFFIVIKKREWRSIIKLSKKTAFEWIGFQLIFKNYLRSLQFIKKQVEISFEQFCNLDWLINEKKFKTIVV